MPDSEDRSSRREELRAKLIRDKARDRRRKRLRVAAFIAAVVVVLGAIGAGIYAATRSTGDEPDVAQISPAGVPMAQTYYSLGAPEGSGKPVADLYLDFMCPYCGDFHKVNGKTIDEAVAADQITLRVHTRTFLDRSSSTGSYSTRAAAAFAEVYSQDPELALPYLDALFENQPQEGNPGLTTKQLADLAKKVGVTEDIAPAVNDGRYTSWLHDRVEPAASSEQSSTPAFLVNGTKVESWNEDGTVLAAITAASGS